VNRSGNSEVDTPIRILDVAEEVLEESGEANLRVAEVAERCGIAVGLIYHYYRDRTALVAAVRLRQYTRSVESDIALMASLQEAGSTPETVYAVTLESMSNLESEERRRSRRQRLAVLATAQHNEELRVAVEAKQQELSEQIIEIVASYQQQGFLDASVDPKSVALLLEALPLGLAILDTNPNMAPEVDGWNTMISRMIAAIVAIPNPGNR
jgi:AcrR family transcriptional regulator